MSDEQEKKNWGVWRHVLDDPFNHLNFWVIEKFNGQNPVYWLGTKEEAKAKALRLMIEHYHQNNFKFVPHKFNQNLANIQE
jgi:hypothetical protein